MVDERIKLPGVLAEIEECIGRDAAITIARVFGGTSLAVPAKIDEEHGLARTIGLDNALALRKRFFGDTIYVPQATKVVSRYLSEKGLNNREIAQEVHRTDRSVRRHLA